MPSRKFPQPPEPRDAVRWVRDHLPDVQGGGREVAHWIQDHVRKPSGRDLLVVSRRAEAGTILWPTVLAAAGAGAAFWWWTSWSRGRAEAERDALGGEEGARKPQEVMAHAPSPGVPLHEPVDASEARLEAPAEQIMAHAPPPSAGGKLKKVKPVVAPVAKEALQRNLAVQASPDAPPRKARAPKAAS